MTGPAQKQNEISRKISAEKLGDIKRKWLNLIEREEIAFRNCTRLDGEHSDVSKEKSEAVRHWWNITNSILWMFSRTRAQYSFELEPFPLVTLARLAIISEEISVGNIPKLVIDAKAGGRKRWLGEREHIAFAVFYHESVSRGEIDDTSPTKTIADLYRVSHRAVQKWLKERDEICVGVPHQHLAPKQIEEKMRKCAEFYYVNGRGNQPM